MSNPDYITINHACRIVGGEEKPISVATYYRRVKAGRLPAPEHPTPGLSRIRRGELIAKLNRVDPPPKNTTVANSYLQQERRRGQDASAGSLSTSSNKRIERSRQAPLNGRARA